MNKFLKYLAGSMIALSLASCSSLYDAHEEYLTAEEVYIGLADSLQANGGFKRVELKWILNADPRIKECEITWNGCEAPVLVDASNAIPGEYMSKIVDVPEGKYIFKIVVKGQSGKESLSQTISGESYGDVYQSRLPQRSISSMTATPEKVTINWLPEENCVGVKVRYVKNEDDNKEMLVTEEEELTYISDFVPGGEFELVSLYKPEANAYDIIESLPTKRIFPSFYEISKSEWDGGMHALYQDLDRTGWTVEANTEELEGEGAVNGHATALLDGDLSTFWHSQWQGDKPTLPHVIIFDMQKENTISSIELARRANNRDTKKVVFSISSDKNNWISLGELSFPNDPNPNAKILLLGKAVKGRYVRLVVTDSNNAPHASIAEVLFTSGLKK